MTPGPAAAITIQDLEQARRILRLERALQERRQRDPSEWYTPHRGQEAFHRAPHPIRLVVPGNGWGKTTAAGAEVHWWATHSHPWVPTPPWPVQMVWFVKAKTQFELVRTQLQEVVFGTTARWVKERFQWPDGSTLYMGSADQRQDWQKWQGIPADLIVFDEFPPLGLWREMYMRRRAKRKTRYIIAATATESDVWAEEAIYAKWRDHHVLAGYDEERAIRIQSHPRFWVLPRGGIDDNPHADAEDRQWYHDSDWSNEKEKKVRLYGGFESWTGDAVFDAAWMEAALARLEADRKARGTGGRIGFLEVA